MYSDYFNKIKRIIDEFGKVKIINRKGIEMDITTEMRIIFVEMNTLLSISREPKPQESKPVEKVDKYAYNMMAKELAKARLELKSLRPIKKWRDDQRIKKQIYLASEEGIISKKITKGVSYDPHVELVKEQRKKILNQQIDEELLAFPSDEELEKEIKKLKE